jgi:uncharacterized membrane protein YfbV (UPF0208 family)
MASSDMQYAVLLSFQVSNCSLLWQQAYVVLASCNGATSLVLLGLAMAGLARLSRLGVAST